MSIFQKIWINTKFGYLALFGLFQSSLSWKLRYKCNSSTVLNTINSKKKTTSKVDAK